MLKENEIKPLKQPAVRCSFISKLLCLMGWHQYTCKIQDCIDEFGYVPSDGRMPKVAKCSRCDKNYT